MNDRHSVLIFEDELWALHSLSDDQRGRVLDAIICKELGEEIPTLETAENALFGLIWSQIERAKDLSKVRRESAKARWNKANSGNDSTNSLQKRANTKQTDASVCTNIETETQTGVNSEESLPKANKKNEYTVSFEEFWSAYPKKVDKGMAYRNYRARKNDGYSDEELIQAAKAYAVQCEKQKTDKQYIKHPKTFLSDSMPFLDFLNKKDPQASMNDIDKALIEGKNPFDDWISSK